MEKSFDNIRVYHRKECIVFRKTGEEFGGLSNMAAGFPILIGTTRILTSEALYQCCRFPHMPDVQELILRQSSPMTAKMKSKPFRKDSRPDWESVKVPIMKWCLRVKLIQNWPRFSELLLKTGNKAIVEESSKDSYWGAKVIYPDILEGENVLGRLLMDLREKLKADDVSREVPPLSIESFFLLGSPIPFIAKPTYPSVSSLKLRDHKHDLFS